MLVRCSRDMRYRFISDAYAHLIGQTRAEILGKTISEVLGEQGLATLRPYTERVLRGEAVNFECNLDFANVGSRRLSSPIGPNSTPRAKPSAGSPRCSTSPSSAAPKPRWRGAPMSRPRSIGSPTGSIGRHP
jgi:PAS domain-containing protein